MKTIFLFLGLLGFSIPLIAQEELENSDSSRIEEVICIAPLPIYTTWPKKLNTEDFYFANDLDPAYLFRGRVSGLLIARPGSNPLEKYTFKNRGMSSFQGVQAPLFLIDGFPVLSMESLEPLDITSFEIDQDIALTSGYGLRGANGVINIQTFEPLDDKTIRQLTYKTYNTLDLAIKDTKVLDAQAFKEEGGTDLGAETDWWNAISRPGLSTAHHLSLSQRVDQLQYAVSGHYRAGSNTLINSGYQQYGIRLGFQQQYFKEKLQLRASYSALSRNMEPGFKNSYAYASNRNPTAPVFDENNTSFGGYHEQLIFESYNPVSILEQNKLEQDQYVQQAKLSLAYKFVLGTWINLNLATEKNEFVQNEYYPTTSFWGNNLHFYSDEDIELEQKALKKNRFLDAFIKYKNYRFIMQGGYRFQEYAFEGLTYGYSDFGREHFDYVGQDAPIFEYEEIKAFAYQHHLSTFYGSVYKQFDEKLALKANYSVESSSYLGDHAKWGKYGGLYLEAPLNELLHKPKLKINLTVGYGIAGNVPRTYDLSRTLWQATGELSYQNGSFEPIYARIQRGNPDLKAEKVREWNIGFKIPAHYWDFKMNFFNKKTSGLIEGLHLSRQIFNFSYTLPPEWTNLGELTSSGFELDFQALVYASNWDFQWKTQFNLYAFKTKINNSITSARVPVYDQLATDDEIVGGINGFIFLGFDDNGNSTYKNINGDNFFCYCSDDFDYLGSTLPKLNLGWQNKFQFNKLEIMLSMYASLGHHVINERFIKYGSTQLLFAYNIPQGTLEGPIQNTTEFPRFSDYYFEKASFLRIEQITLRYPFILKNESKIMAYLGFNNLFTFHKYSGGNPETRLDIYGDGLTHGVDFADSYPMTRSVVLGIEVDLITKKPVRQLKEGETMILE